MREDMFKIIVERPRREPETLRTPTARAYKKPKRKPRTSTPLFAQAAGS